MSHSTTNCIWRIILLEVICLRNKIRNLIFAIKPIYQFLSTTDTLSFAVSWWWWVIWNHHTFMRFIIWQWRIDHTFSLRMNVSWRTSSWCRFFLRRDYLFFNIHIGNIKLNPLRLTVSFLWFLHLFYYFNFKYKFKKLIVL